MAAAGSRGGGWDAHRGGCKRGCARVQVDKKFKAVSCKYNQAVGVLSECVTGCCKEEAFHAAA